MFYDDEISQSLEENRIYSYNIINTFYFISTKYTPNSNFFIEIRSHKNKTIIFDTKLKLIPKSLFYQNAGKNPKMPMRTIVPIANRRVGVVSILTWKKETQTSRYTLIYLFPFILRFCSHSPRIQCEQRPTWNNIGGILWRML